MRIAIGLLAATACLYAGITQGIPVTYCPSNANGVCYGVAVPSSSASAGSGNIYFQISAPTSFSWVALGTGSRMDGSNMFLMYEDGAGNVTLSPRLGTQHTMPTLDTSSTAARLTLLAGSGVSPDGKTMTANVACANCETWSGGSLSLASTQSNWVAAWRSGNPIDTTSQSASISVHDDTATFVMDLTKATVASDSNPFVAESGSGSDPGSDPGSGSGSGSGSPPSDNSGGVTVVAAGRPSQTVLAAHGIIMALVMLVLYPLGSVLMPLLGVWQAHAAWQIVTFVLMWAGFALGVQYARGADMLFTQTHTTLGTAIVSLFVLQPALGFLHHHNYVKTGGRTPVSHAHIWYGRVLILLGVINGGLGLQLATASHAQVVAYSVVAVAVFLVYLVVKALTVIRDRRRDVYRGKNVSRSPPSLHNSRYAGERGAAYELRQNTNRHGLAD